MSRSNRSRVERDRDVTATDRWAVAWRLAQMVVLIVLVLFPGACSGDSDGEEDIAHPKFESCNGSADASALSPIFECLATTSSGHAYAVWGYENSSAGEILAPLGPQNIFSPDPSGRGQPTLFEPGTHHAVFAQALSPADLVTTWTLGVSTKMVNALVPGSVCTPTTSTGGEAVTIGGATLLLEANPDVEFADSIVDTNVTEASSPNDPFQVTTGALPGSFQVSADGAATYAIPLEVPPGRAGVQPQLALAYNSYAGNGPLGVGWSLSGLSQISRCNKTYSSPTGVPPGTDAAAEAIHFDNTDRLCLDGDYLIPVGGADSNGEVHEYRAEHRPYDKITVDGFDGLGPNSFTIHLRDGRIQRYGTVGARLEGLPVGWAVDSTDTIARAPSALVRYAWMLTETADRSGNALWIEYEDPDVTCAAGFPSACNSYALLPKTINYTARQSDPPATPGGVDRPARRSVRFVYDDTTSPRPDQELSYVSGLGLRLSHRLLRVEMWAPNPAAERLVRSYNLGYDRTSVSGRSLLTTVQECDAGGPSGVVVCEKPTRLSYEGGDTAFYAHATGITEPMDNPSQQHWALIPADINGDGMDDIVYARRDPQNPPNQTFELVRWHYRLSTGNDFGDDKPTSLTQVIVRDDETVAPLRIPTPVPVDIDGDGALELAFPTTWNTDTDPPAFWRYVRFNGTDFESIPSESDSLEQAGCKEFACTVPTGLFAGDLNGDGLPDFLRQFITDISFSGPPCGSGGFCLWAEWATRWDTGPGTGLFPNWDIVKNADGVFFDVAGGWNSYLADLDGSGRTALVFQALNTPDFSKLGTRFSSMTSPGRDSGTLGPFNVAGTTLAASNDGPSGFHYLFLDVNGDGVSDILRFPNDGSYPQMAVNTAAGFPEPWEAVDPGPYKTPGWGFAPLFGDSSKPALDGGVRLADLNGDGHADLVLMGQNGPARASEGGFSGMSWYPSHYAPPNFRLLHGGLLVSIPPPTPPSPPSTTTITARSYGDPGLYLSQVLDINGDGLVDMVQMGGDGQMYIYIHAGNKVDQLTQIVDGLGSKTSIQYSPIVARASGCIFPNTCVSRGIWAATEWEIDAPEGTGSTGAKQFIAKYEGPSFDAQGRGFLGFAKRTITDTKFNNTWTTTYDNTTRKGSAYPQAGMPQNQTHEVTLSSGTHLKEMTSWLYETHGLPESGQPFSVAPQQIEEVESETPPGGTESIYRHVRSTFFYDGFDNLGLTTHEALIEGSVRTTTIEYDNLTGPWLLGLPRKMTDSDQTSDKKLVTRTRMFDVDHTTGLLRSITIEPGGGPGISEQMEYVRNRDGIAIDFIKTDITTGVQRETDIQLDPVEGMFPRSVTNSMGHVELVDYHPAFGLVVRRQAPDGFVTHYQYDGFGRLRSEVPQIGPSKTVDYAKGDFGTDVVTTLSDGTYQVASFDRLNREYRRRANSFDGIRLTEQDVVYDAFFLDKPSLIRKPFFVGDSSAPIFERFTYDEIGRLIRQSTDGAGTTKFAYANAAPGLKTTVTDAVNDVRYTVADELGRTTKSVSVLVDPTDPTSSSEIATQFVYDPFELVRSTTTAGVTVGAVYDVRGRRIESDDPDAGKMTYVYNGFGDLIEQDDARPSATTYGYDSIGRIIGTKDIDGVTCFYYDKSKSGTGKIASSTSPDNVTKSFAYDLDGRLGKGADPPARQLDRADVCTGVRVARGVDIA